MRQGDGRGLRRVDKHGNNVLDATRVGRQRSRVELFRAVLLAAIALLFDYLGLTYGHAWLAWGAAILGWCAVFVWTGRKAGKHRNAILAVWAAAMVIGTVGLLKGTPHEFSENHHKQPAGADTMAIRGLQ